MKRFRQFGLVGSFLYVGWCGLGCWPLPPSPVLLEEGFENGLAEWEQGADVPDDPNNPGQPVAWSIQQSDVVSVEGDYSARYFLDGRQDDGTIWLVRSLQVEPATRYTVTLAIDFWSETESFNTIAKVALFVGTDPPNKETDFDTSRPANQMEGWETYSLQAEVTSDINGKVRVAFGISAVWETEMTYFIDNVVLKAEAANEWD
jgi:hypothetical protein